MLISLLLATPAVAAEPSGLTMLSEAEQSYYEKIFDYTMETTKMPESYGWESYGGKGNITPGEPFVSKSGYTCRTFAETYTVAGKDGYGTGIGCKRQGRDGWCKLESDAVLSCAMEPSRNMGESISDKAQEGVENASDLIGKAKGLIR